MHVLFFSVLCGTNKTLKAIVLLFCSTFSSLLSVMEHLFLSSYTDQFKVQFLIIFEGYFQCFDDLMQQLKRTENNYHHYFVDLLLCFYFSTVQESLNLNLYITSLQTYFLKVVIQ